MSDYVFKSSLSIEEIEENFKDFDIFEGVKAGFEEALAYEKAKLHPKLLQEKGIVRSDI